MSIVDHWHFNGFAIRLVLRGAGLRFQPSCAACFCLAAPSCSGQPRPPPLAAAATAAAGCQFAGCAVWARAGLIEVILSLRSRHQAAVCAPSGPGVSGGPVGTVGGSLGSLAGPAPDCMGRQFLDAETERVGLDWLGAALAPPLPAHPRALLPPPILSAACRWSPAAMPIQRVSRPLVLLAAAAPCWPIRWAWGKNPSTALDRRPGDWPACADCRIAVSAPGGLHAHWRQEAIALGLQLEFDQLGPDFPAALPPAGTVFLLRWMRRTMPEILAAARTQALLRLGASPPSARHLVLPGRR